MAITLDDLLEEASVTFDTASAAGTETIKAAVTGKTFGVKSLEMSVDTAGEYTLAVSGRNRMWQLPAYGGFEWHPGEVFWGDTTASAITIVGPAGQVSGTLKYASR